MRNRKSFKIIVPFGLMVVVLICFAYLSPLNLGEVLEGRSLNSYNKVKIISTKDNNDMEYKNSDVSDILNQLYQLNVTRTLQGSHWDQQKHIQEKEYQFEMLFHDGISGYFRIRLCEQQVSFRLPENKRYSGYDFNTYRISDKEQYREIARHLSEMLQ